MSVDIAIAVATDLEWDALGNVGLKFEPVLAEWTNFNQAEIAISKSGLTVCRIRPIQMGQVNAAVLACKAVYDFEPAAIISAGIAAGVPGRASILDVLIANNVHDVSLAKETRDPVSAIKSRQPDLTPGETSDRLTSLLHKHAKVILNDIPPSWLSDAQLIQDNKEHGRRHWDGPLALRGDIICGNAVLNDKDAILNLAMPCRQAKGYEMESFGFTEALRQFDGNAHPVHRPQFAMIKGVVDLGCNKKDDWQARAAKLVMDTISRFLDDGATVASYRREWSKRRDGTKRRVVALIRSQKDESPRVLDDLADALIKEGFSEIEAAIKGDYSVNLEHGRQFLLRARPLFGQARRILATSLDAVSRFWIDPLSSQNASEYLSVQKIGRQRDRTVARIFVFGSPQSMHRHAIVLDQHVRAYEHVYACSIEGYRSLFRHVLEPVDASQRYSCDFAVLDYSDGKSLVASLDAHQLSFAPVGSRPNQVDSLLVERLFEKLFNIPRGRAEMVSAGRNASAAVVAWQEDLWNSKRWPDVVRTLFPIMERDVVHMVFVHCDQEWGKEFERRFAKVKAELYRRADGALSLAERMQIEAIWFGSACSFQDAPRDAKTRGAVRTALSPSHVLTMRFKSQKALKEFYEDSGHSQIRHELYRAISRDAGIVFDALSQADPKALAAAYNLAESDVARWLHRRDFFDGEEIADIVEQPPYDPTQVRDL